MKAVERRCGKVFCPWRGRAEGAWAGETGASALKIKGIGSGVGWGYRFSSVFSSSAGRFVVESAT